MSVASSKQPFKNCKPQTPTLFYLWFMGQYSIGEAIKHFLKGSRIKGDIQALQIEEIWEKIMGKTIARYTSNIKIIHHTLFITTNVAPLKQELLYQKEKIKLRVNEALGTNEIAEVIIQ
jgi:hypothetical protein